jgi:histone acetyltransferase (RNA polymerase elongator complex component)
MLTAQKIIDLAPDFVRIYPTIVLSGSVLETWLSMGRYTPMPLDQCVSLVKEIYLLFRKNNIPVIRMGLQPTEALQAKGEILQGPYHPSFGHLVYSEIFLDRIVSLIMADKINPRTMVIRIHPRDISTLQGIKKRNLHLLATRYGAKTIDIIGDSSLEPNMIMVNGHRANPSF